MNTGSENTAVGSYSMWQHTAGDRNSAFGDDSLSAANSGSDNTAIGHKALQNNTGNGNIALGIQAGINITTGSNNIIIGNSGDLSDNNVIRIGNNQTATLVAGIYNSPLMTGSGAHPVYVDATGRLFADQTVTASITPEEFQKLQQTIEEQKATIEQQRTEFETQVAQQKKMLETLTAQVKAQNEQLQKVTVRMEQGRVPAQKVANRK